MVNELLNLLVFSWLCLFAEQPKSVEHWPRPAFVMTSYIGFWVVCFVCIGMVQWFGRLFRQSFRIDTSTPKYLVPTFQTFYHETRDGVNIKIRIAKSNKSSKVMLLAAPLGQCGPEIFNPIMCWFGPEFTYISWDYRGFFGSAKPARLRKISVPEHANDAVEVLHACGFSKADVMVGHSMGTAVTLETILLFPEAVTSFVLLNGFHGHVFSTAFQLIFRVPGVGDMVGEIVNLLLRNPQWLDTARHVLAPITQVVLPVYARLFGSRMLKKIHGERYLLDFWENYIGQICKSRSNMESYLQLFQELDAHSVYHLLPTITHPALLISGFLDFCTPSMQSTEISRQIPQAVHYCDPFSTHATILESPEWCVAEIDVFLCKHVLAGDEATNKKQR